MSVSPLPGVGWMSLPVVQLAVVAWELILGIWLISNFVRPLSWLIALVTFSVFAGVSSYFGIIGQASCGCFGTIEASPWAAFGVDVIAVASLTFVRPSRNEWYEAISAFQVGFRLLLGTAAAVVILSLISIYIFGSVSVGLAKLTGESLSAPAYIDFGNTKSGEDRQAAVEVRNWTNRPVRLIGGTSDCTCVTTSYLPLVIQPGETISLIIYLRIPSVSSGVFTRTATLSTDCDEKRTITFRLGCRVD